MIDVPKLSPELSPDRNEPGRDAYHRSIRLLHWTMAVGFVLMWLTGVLVTNIEGVSFFVEADRQGAIRDLHKSIGLTLLALLAIRVILRITLASPPLPPSIPLRERRVAHAGHVTIYGTIILASITGLAIADLHGYGNAYFGIELPQIFSTREWLAGWAVNPWSYILHAIVVYGLLALVVGHVVAVWMHARFHGADLLPRVLPQQRGNSRRTLSRLCVIAAAVAITIIALAARGFVTQGPLEEARDYRTTTPFSARSVAPQ